LTVRSGIAPFDERIEGLRAGGLYLLAAEPGAARLAFLLQYLDRGLRDGERVVLLSSAPPEQTIEQAEFWGMDLEGAWKQDRCILLGFRDEYAARVAHSPDPAEPFAELDRLLTGRVARLAVDPGTGLWEARSDSSMAGAFLSWSRDLGATTLVTVPIDLDEENGKPTEWVAQRARGVFRMTKDSRGLHELEVVRISPPTSDEGPVLLELSAGLGLVGPTGKGERGQTARPDTSKLLLLRLAEPVPRDLAGWLERRYSVESIRDARECVARSRTGRFGAHFIYANRRRIEEAIDTGRSLREFSSAVMLLLSDEPLRAADAARALDAGFDDVLSGVVDLRELESRFRRASDAPRSQKVEREMRPQPMTEPLDAAEFHSVVSERLMGEGLDQFTLLHFESPGEEVGPLLFEDVRAGDGDVVGRTRHGWGVLLQNARVQQAESYLQRLRTRVAETGSPLPLSAEILAAPEQSERIRVLLTD
jgi:hypothetical protein